MKMKASEFLENNVIENVVDGHQKLITKNDALNAVILAHSDAVKKWTMWCFNYPTPFEQTICNIWGGKLSGFGGRYYCEENYFTQHLIEKWQSLENRGDSRMMFFYCDLDCRMQKELVDWVMTNYAG